VTSGNKAIGLLQVGVYILSLLRHIYNYSFSQMATEVDAKKLEETKKV
jgi:hypothetical protein